METNVELNAPTEEREEKYKHLKSILGVLIKNKAALVGLIIILVLTLIAFFGSFIMPYDPYVGELSKSLQAPSAAHIFGTDEQGRDILSRIIDGTKISLRVGVTSVAIALSIGTVVGALAGYYGGKIDMLLMRIMDIVLAFPSLLLAIAFMSALGKGIDKAVIAITQKQTQPLQT